MRASFEAAWMPYSVVDYEEAVRPAVGWLTRRTGRPKVVALHEMRAATYTPSLTQYARVAEKITPRSRGRSAQGNDVLAYVPDWKLLELAVSRASGGSIAVVEEFDVVMRGWAQAVGALNLGTGLTTPDLATDDVREAVERIHFYGNNGWGKYYATARRMTASTLRELSAAGWTDGSRIIGGVFALGKSPALLEELGSLVEETFGPLAFPLRPGWEYSRAEGALLCAVDGFPMVDVEMNHWLCRSCGHEEVGRTA